MQKGQAWHASHAYAKRKPTLGLTKREWQMAELVERGLTNREIGEKLSITEGSVHARLSLIFKKLNISRNGNSRMLLRNWVQERKASPVGSHPDCDRCVCRGFVRWALVAAGQVLEVEN